MPDEKLLAQLRHQFASTHWPRFDDLNHSDNFFALDIFIGGDMHWLQGHFPQQSVVAGVVQTHWAGEIAKQLFNLSDEFIRIDNLKFQQVILPEQRLQLTLDAKITDSSCAIKFCYRKDEILFSEGKLVFSNQVSSQ